MKRLGIVGSGLAGLTCAYKLQHEYDITVFEKDDRLGGHVLTVSTPHGPVSPYVMTFTPAMYTRFFKLIDELGYGGFRPAPLRIVVHSNGEVLHSDPPNSLEMLRKNFWTYADFRSAPSFRHWAQFLAFMGQFYWDYKRNRFPPEARVEELKDYYPQHRGIINYWALPFAALKSSVSQTITELARTVFGAFRLDALIQGEFALTVPNGVHEYIDLMVSKTKATFELSTPVASLTRQGDGHRIVTEAGESHDFDRVIVATPPLVAPKFLDPSNDELQTLFHDLRPLYDSMVILIHWDDSVMCNISQVHGASGGFNYDPATNINTTSVFLPGLIPGFGANGGAESKLFVTYMDPAHLDFFGTPDWKSLDWQSLPRGSRIDPEKIIFCKPELHAMWGQPEQRRRFKQISDYSGRDGLFFCGVGLDGESTIGQEGAVSSALKTVRDIRRG